MLPIISKLALLAQSTSKYWGFRTDNPNILGRQLGDGWVRARRARPIPQCWRLIIPP